MSMNIQRFPRTDRPRGAGPGARRLRRRHADPVEPAAGRRRRSDGRGRERPVVARARCRPRTQRRPRGPAPRRRSCRARAAPAPRRPRGAAPTAQPRPRRSSGAGRHRAAGDEHAVVPGLRARAHAAPPGTRRVARCAAAPAPAAAMPARAPAAPAAAAPEQPPQPPRRAGGAVAEADRPSARAEASAARRRRPTRRRSCRTASAAASMAELQAMKQLMEDRFNTLSWLGQARQDPIHSNLMLKLVRAGYSPALARTRAGADRHGAATPTDAVREVMATLERMLGADAGSALDGRRRRRVRADRRHRRRQDHHRRQAGRASARRLHGAASVGLITLDTHRAGAHEQLRAYGRSLGVVAHLAHDRAALQELLDLLSGKKMVLIDTAGIAPRDPRRQRTARPAATCPASSACWCSTPARTATRSTRSRPASRSAARARRCCPRSTRPPSSARRSTRVIRHQLVLRGVTNGQRVPQDWKAADARRAGARIDARRPSVALRSAQRRHGLLLLAGGLRRLTRTDATA